MVNLPGLPELQASISKTELPTVVALHGSASVLLDQGFHAHEDPSGRLLRKRGCRGAGDVTTVGVRVSTPDGSVKRREPFMLWEVATFVTLLQ